MPRLSIIIQVLFSFFCNAYAVPIDNKQSSGLEQLNKDHSQVEIHSMYGLDLIILLLGALCALYTIIRTFLIKRAKHLHMSHKLPFYMALSDFFIFIALIIDLSYPGLIGKQWPDQSCKIISLTFYYFAIFNMILVGSLAVINYFRVCKGMHINTGLLDYKLFVFPFLIPAILSIPAWPYFGANGYWCFQNRTSSFIPLVLLYMDIIILMTSLFCYIGIAHSINVSRFRNDQENFRNSNRKIIGYLFMYILQWTPVMVYIISDIEHQANMWIFAICITSLPIGGIVNTCRYISNEGWWNTDPELGQDSSPRNERNIHSVKNFGGPPTVSQWRELSGDDDTISNQSSIIIENDQLQDQIQLQNQVQPQIGSSQSQDKISLNEFSQSQDKISLNESSQPQDKIQPQISLNESSQSQDKISLNESSQSQDKISLNESNQPQDKIQPQISLNESSQPQDKIQPQMSEDDRSQNNIQPQISEDNRSQNNIQPQISEDNRSQDNVQLQPLSEG